MNHITTYQQSSLRPANGGYRYFFNGQESDGEVYGEGGLQLMIDAIMDKYASSDGPSRIYDCTKNIKENAKKSK